MNFSRNKQITNNRSSYGKENYVINWLDAKILDRETHRKKR